MGILAIPAPQKIIDDYKLYDDLYSANIKAVYNYPTTVHLTQVKNEIGYVLPINVCMRLKDLGYNDSSLFYYNTYTINPGNYNIKRVNNPVCNGELRPGEYIIPQGNIIEYLNFLYKHPEINPHEKINSNTGNSGANKRCGIL